MQTHNVNTAPGLNPESEHRWKLPRQFTTAKGSVYTLGEDNRYSRFKATTGERDLPSNLVVFMDMPKPYDPYFELKFLTASQNKGLIIVVQLDKGGDWDGLVISASDVKDPNRLSVVVADKETYEVEAQVDATLFPEIGKQVFEYSEEAEMKYTHVGHEVIDITD